MLTSRLTGDAQIVQRGEGEGAGLLGIAARTGTHGPGPRRRRLRQTGRVPMPCLLPLPSVADAEQPAHWAPSRPAPPMARLKNGAPVKKADNEYFRPFSTLVAIITKRRIAQCTIHMHTGRPQQGVLRRGECCAAPPLVKKVRIYSP